MKKEADKKRIYAKLFLVVTSLLICLLMMSSCADMAVIVGIKDVEINENGELVVNYTNGESENLGVVVGEDGKDFTASVENVYNNSITIEGTTDDVSAVARKGLGSTVSIICRSDSGAASGSGVIYKLNKANGEAFIITNYHVVHSDSIVTNGGIYDDISVYLYGSETYLEETDTAGIEAEYVGGSVNYDIAVLHVVHSGVLRTSKIASPVTFGDSSAAKVGSSAVAIGNPEGEGLSVTAGVVSKESEYIYLLKSENSNEYISMRLMRIDASVNPGNSGGGLYNSSGELIGIVNAKIVAEDVESIGYAIPSNVALAVAENIIDTCYKTNKTAVQKCLIGVTLGYIDGHAEVDENGKIYTKETVFADEVSRSSIAFGKIREGDVFKSVKIGDRQFEVNMFYNVTEAMLWARVGDTVIFEIERDGEPMTVELVMTANGVTEY